LAFQVILATKTETINKVGKGNFSYSVVSDLCHRYRLRLTKSYRCADC
jgi:hypothetical protein